MAPADVESLDYLCLSKGNFEILLRDLLLVKNYRVEVFTRSNKTNEWSIEFKGSPGNLTQFESMLFQSNENVTGTSIIGLNLRVDGSVKVGFFLNFIVITISNYISFFFLENWRRLH